MEKLEFVTRATKETTELYVRRIWRSRCGRFRVSEFRRLLEPSSRKVYYAERRRESGSPGWDVISRHVKRSTAIDACNFRNRVEAVV